MFYLLYLLLFFLNPLFTWLKQTFTEADKNGDGSLSISEVLQLIHKLNVNLPRQKVKQMFKEADTDDNQGTLGFEEFCAFYKMMSTRRDLYLLMLTYSNHKDHLDTDDLIRFLEIEQKMLNVTKEHCLEIVEKFEPCPENRKQGVLGIDGFTNYMRSPAGDIFNPEHHQVHQDMRQRLCNYFIASSHNTYLMGDQLMSQSRADMYAWVLQAGCRCVEVDCWDGPDGEPIVHHGYTLTSKILFKDVIETINKYAFIKNDYPVIISLENHCSVPQQKKMAQYLIDVLGDKLDLSSVNMDESGQLPPPEHLRGKILVKGKKLPPNIDENAEEGEVSDEDSADEIEDDCKLMNGDQKSSPSAGDKRVGKVEDDAELGEKDNLNKRQSRSFMGNFSKRKKKTVKLKKSSSFEDEEDELETSVSASRGAAHYSRMSRQKKTMKLSRALSDLVKYTKSVGVQDIETQVSSSWQVSSLSETKAHQIMQQKPTQFIHFNQRQLSRVYPSSYRVDSSNYNPQPFWNAGCHLVALNYQSEGRVLQLNRAKFNSNGNCGYVLKPKCMCEGAFNPMSEDPLPGQMKKQLVLKIISGQQLPKPKDSMLGDRGEIIDPFVEVEIIGLPADCCKEQTRVVDDNGFNPMWEETLVFTMHMPEIALVRFLVWDHDPIGRDFIGQRTIAFSSMMPGYRHVYLEGMEEASIFVHIAVNDITGKVRQAIGIKGLFHRNPKQASLDSHAAAQLSRKHPFGAHLLRRTASAPTKGQQKVKKGFPEISIDNKEYSSEGASEDRESEDACQPRVDCETDSGARVAAVAIADSANGELHSESFKDKETSFPPSSASHLHTLETITEEAHNAEDNSAVQIPSAHLASGPSLYGYSETLAIECIGPSQLDQASDDVCQHSPLCKEHDSVMEGATQSLRTTEGNTNLEVTNSPSNLTPSLSNSFHAGSEEVNSAISITGQVNGLNPETNTLNAWQVKKNKQEEENNNGKHPQNAISVNLPMDLSEKVLATKVPEVSQAASSKAHVLVRRSKSEGYVRLANPENSQWMVPEVCTDVTLNDRLWSKLENHRDSVSSSSSISSSDTVIDLSLPNLAHKSLTDLNTSGDESLEVILKNEVARPRSATTGCEIPRVTKSKSNPNLRVEEDLETPHNLQTRPLVKEPVQAMQRRHTWSRLFVESLKQTSQSKKPASSVNSEVDGPSKSKSLGDLTSDDIMCNFESKYRSISRSFITRSMRDQRKPPKKSHDHLTEQIKQLTAVEPLTASDFASSSLNATEQEDETFCFLRRSSSRSQSRVRYIANRAKQAQERQRLQGLSRMSSSPIEERGNPEGACCMSKGTCADSDLLSQLPAAPPVRQLSDIEAEVFFMLKL
ncbi:1-phosphatidylinositol 4,5-bisphosphate phosphodiesterase eta-2a isoform X1 [Erpetoichthys calabaricus]|uniref:1-phosphatidylinositol 4,5-bisphosphate phosphodiesterase eta-2a isoform X1 n=1 Tax=Erpetoichthys calabaricus TaxID=27687 RepID=UPI002233F63D|nr:1-phosphatidylinositol 4,5-bisphosphate phosphodiesterase eta-2a isoform X1 [Erpetoichthys calabaricus]